VRLKGTNFDAAKVIMERYALNNSGVQFFDDAMEAAKVSVDMAAQIK
jgi:succinyl-CoA synthetase beta subunit